LVPASLRNAGRIRRLLERLPEHFAEVRELLNELARTVR
jgi:hypothetical protein